MPKSPLTCPRPTGEQPVKMIPSLVSYLSNANHGHPTGRTEGGGHGGARRRTGRRGARRRSGARRPGGARRRGGAERDGAARGGAERGGTGAESCTQHMTFRFFSMQNNEHNRLGRLSDSTDKRNPMESGSRNPTTFLPPGRRPLIVMNCKKWFDVPELGVDVTRMPNLKQALSG